MKSKDKYTMQVLKRRCECLANTLQRRILHAAYSTKREIFIINYDQLKVPAWN